MTTFLLLLSLILNAAAIFAIILLYLRQNRLVEAEKKQERIIKEIEEVFSAYLFELKEENEKFIELMTKRPGKKQSENKKDPSIEIEEEDRNQSPESGNQGDQPPRFGKGISYHAARKAYQQNSEPVSEEEITVELIEELPTSLENGQVSKPLSLIDQVMEMKRQGKSVEEIARVLDKGKTEIELLLKFRQNMQE